MIVKINNISLPVPFKYLTKKGAITGSGADLIKSLKIADIEIYSRALEPYSTYRYYEE